MKITFIEQVPCFCLAAAEPEEKEPGGHHAVTCERYRSPNVGDQAKHWDSKLRELFRLRREWAK